jgi:hypothetical protein
MKAQRPISESEPIVWGMEREDCVARLKTIRCSMIVCETRPSVSATLALPEDLCEPDLSTDLLFDAHAGLHRQSS